LLLQVDWLRDSLQKHNHTVLAAHNTMDQTTLDGVMHKMRSKLPRVLILTDCQARFTDGLQVSIAWRYFKVKLEVSLVWLVCHVSPSRVGLVIFCPLYMPCRFRWSSTLKCH
jgi:hypothetical protein